MTAVKLISGMAMLSVAALGLMGCEKEVILPGERLDPRAVLDGAAPTPAPLSTALSLPRPQANAEWTHRAGNATHALTNPAFGAGMSLAWATPIGTGADRKHRITAEPVIAGGRIFTLDAEARVAATSTAGGALWSTDLTPPADRAGDASGGGLAVAGNRLYATTGFGELVALDAATGAVIWRQKFDAAVGGAPTVSDGIVYVVARDASAWAIEAANGKVLWQLPGVNGAGAMTGVSAPAVNDRLVVFPFSSGEMVASLKSKGLTLWQGKVAGARIGRGYTTISDLTGDPVIVGERLYAGSSAGKLAAFDVNSGEKLWTADVGPVSPVQVAGGAIWLVSDENKLTRVDAATGATVWSVDLPYFEAEKPKKYRTIFVHYGPLLAGGRLYTASSDGLLRAFDPATGAALGQVEIPGGAATEPVVAGGTLYVVSRTGQLLAFR